MLDAVGSRSLRTYFEASVGRAPESTALIIGNESYTYRVLDRHARGIASLITEHGTRHIERVAVFAYRSLGAYTGTLAALYSGAGFVPLNRKFPVDRTSVMIRKAAVNAILVDSSSVQLLPEVLATSGSSATIIALDRKAYDLLCERGVVAQLWIDTPDMPTLQTLPAVQPDDVAYLLFTSGTTGEPKGVAISQANILHFVDNMCERFGLLSTDRCSQAFEQTFDVSVFDLFVTWAAGAVVCAMQPIDLLAPVRFIQNRQLTVWYSVPSVIALAIRKGMLKPNSMPTLRYSLFAGEPLPDASARAWYDAAPCSEIQNLYGPTELTVTCLGHCWDAARPPAVAVNGMVPIGRPHPGMGVLIVDDALNPVPSGTPGEMIVCGPQIAIGYWGDPEKTKEKFVDIAVSPYRSKRFYRTGDRVLRSNDGTYAYIGRVDDQIKVMGFRVELGEIEAVLLRDSRVVQAAAVGYPVEDGRAVGIVAFVCGDAPLAADLVRLASTHLPSYMIPKEVVILDEMPMNSNGKIDRKKLTQRLELRAGPC